MPNNHYITCHDKKWPIFFVVILFLQCQTMKNSPADAAMKLGNKCAKEGLLQEAADNYRIALEKEPKHLMALRNLAIIQTKQGLFKASSHKFLELESMQESDFETCYYLGESLRGLEQYAKAIFYYQKSLMLKPAQVQVLRALAWSFYKVKLYKEAWSVSEKLLSFFPQDSHGIIIAVRVLLKMKKREEAQAMITKNEALLTQKHLATLLHLKADLALEKQNVVVAKDLYKKSLNVNPLSSSVKLGLGKCYFLEKNYKQAIKYLEEAAGSTPSITEAYYLLSQVYEGKPEKAKKYFELFQKKALVDPEYSTLREDP